MKKLEITDNTNDFVDIMISALRYALGRKTYITDVTSKFIIQNITLIPSGKIDVFLRDIIEYEKDRTDDEMDYKVWMELKEDLIKWKQQQM